MGLDFVFVSRCLMCCVLDTGQYIGCDMVAHIIVFYCILIHLFELCWVCYINV